MIARPFEGEPGAFRRRPERRDYSLPPPGPTVLDALVGAGVPVVGDRQDPRHLRCGSGIDGLVVLGLERARGRPHDRARCARPGPRSCSRTSWTSTRSTGIATTPTGTRAAVEAFDAPAAGLLAALDGGVLLDHRRPRLRPDDAVDRPLAGADAAARRRAARWTARHRHAGLVRRSRRDGRRAPRRGAATELRGDELRRSPRAGRAVSRWDPRDAIAAKRDGRTLTPEEVERFVGGRRERAR